MKHMSLRLDSVVSQQCRSAPSVPKYIMLLSHYKCTNNNECSCLGYEVYAYDRSRIAT